MPSKQSEPLIAHYRNSNRLAALDPPLTLAEMRDRDEHRGDVTREPGGVDYLEVDQRRATAATRRQLGVDHERGGRGPGAGGDQLIQRAHLTHRATVVPRSTVARWSPLS
jgi:hypothetical protein